MREGGRWLILSQVYPPDPASVGQHMADVAAMLASRGVGVRVYTSRRGYDDPIVRYPWRERRGGVDVRRLPFTSFGKQTLARRLAGALSFLVQATLIALFTPGLRGILFSTTPPLVGVAPLLARWIRRVPIAYWVMDLNPDQIIALGKLDARSRVSRFLEGINRRILARSDVVVALDRFMAQRLERKARGVNLEIVPPWPHENHLEPKDRLDNPFRREYGLGDAFVVMYSGNHSPSNPLGTLLEAALRLRDRPDIRFVFVGGGTGKREIEAAIREHGLENVISAPYQPIETLAFSLSAADVHVVSLGDPMVGIIHPCKIYGAMAVARPILFLGPKPSHIGDLLDEHEIGWHVAHGDVDGCVALIERIAAMPPSERARIGGTAWTVLRERLSQERLLTRFCDRIEAAARAAG